MRWCSSALRAFGLLCSALLAACGGGSSPSPDFRSSLLSDNVSVFRGQGTWWNPAEPGSGFFVDAQAGRAVVSFFSYDDAGRAVWYTATGPLSGGGSGSHVFQGELLYLTNGPQMDAPFNGAVPTSTSAGTVTVTFDGDRARVDLPRRTFQAEKFYASGASADLAGVHPQTGIFWDSARPGRGFTVEYGNGVVSIGIYAFAADGTPTWHLLVGPLEDGTLATRPTQYNNGQPLQGSWRAPVATPAPQEVRVQFNGACAGTFIAQESLALVRMNIVDPGAPACNGTGGSSQAFSGDLQSEGSADGVGTRAQFSKPRGVAQDAAGNVYVADTNNHSIRKIAVDGRVSTIAGKAGEPGSSDGLAAEARFFSPRSVAVDAQGVVFVADTGNHTIRRIGQDGRVTTLVGMAGTMGPPNAIGRTPKVGDAATLSSPHELSMDGAGNLYFLNAGSLVKVTPSGAATMFLASLYSAAAVAANGDAYVVPMNGGSSTEVLRFSPSGVRVKFGSLDAVSVPHAQSLAVAADGSVFVTVGPGPSFTEDPGRRLIRIAPDGTKTQVTGGQDARTINGPLATARFRDPTAVSVHGSGRIVIMETEVGAVRAISPQGIVSTLAGGQGDGYADGPAHVARFSEPKGLAIAADGSLRVADSGNALLRHVSTDGAASTPALKDAGGAPFRFTPEPSWREVVRDVAISPDGRTFVSVDRVSATPGSTVYSVDTAGRVTHYADFNDLVKAIAVGPEGALYALTQLGALTARSPGGTPRALGNAGCLPADLAVSASGQAYAACDGRHTVVAINASGPATIVAGVQDQPGVVDGSHPVGRLSSPSALAVDPAGTVYVADASTVRAITPNGLVTVAGGPSQALVPGIKGRVAGLAVVGGFLYATMQSAVIRLNVGNH